MNLHWMLYDGEFNENNSLILNSKFDSTELKCTKCHLSLNNDANVRSCTISIRTDITEYYYDDSNLQPIIFKFQVVITTSTRGKINFTHIANIERNINESFYKYYSADVLDDDLRSGVINDSISLNIEKHITFTISHDKSKNKLELLLNGIPFLDKTLQIFATIDFIQCKFTIWNSPLSLTLSNIDTKYEINI